MNIATLLEENETYLQPLREAGIKVYLGILPHHSGAWLTDMSAYGCEEFAKEVAGIVKDAGLDGVSLDDEYGDSLPDYIGGPTSPINGIDRFGCSAASVELAAHKGGFISTDGWQGNYGWCMWFSFNPCKREKELQYCMDYFNRMAEPVHGMKVQQPTGYYKKIDQTLYAPKHYEF